MDHRAGARQGYRDARVIRYGIALLRYCERVDASLRGRWEGLNDQLQRAAASALTNAGEALDEESIGDKRRLFRYAYRSCGECERALAGLRAVNAVSAELHEEGRLRIRDIKLDLTRLITWTKNNPR